MIADSPSYYDHQMILEIEIDNLKRNCVNIFDTLENISFE